MADTDLGSNKNTAQSVPLHLPEALLRETAEIHWVCQIDGTLVTIGAAAKFIYGCSIEELLADRDRRAQSIHPEDQAGYRDFFAQLVDGRTTRYSYRLVDPDGTIHWLTDLAALSEQDGKPIVYGLTRVTDEQQRVETALGDAEAVYLSLVESLPLSVLRKDTKGRIQFANARACESMGKTVEELIGKTDFDLFPADLAKKYMDDDEAVIQSGKLHHDVERHQAPGNQQIHVEVWKSPVHGAHGDVIGIQVMF